MFVSPYWPCGFPPTPLCSRLSYGNYIASPYYKNEQVPVVASYKHNIVIVLMPVQESIHAAEFLDHLLPCHGSSDPKASTICCHFVFLFFFRNILQFTVPATYIKLKTAYCTLTLTNDRRDKQTDCINKTTFPWIWRGKSSLFLLDHCRPVAGSLILFMRTFDLGFNTWIMFELIQVA